ncbi:MAG TPA: hypothetical protein VFP84_30825 [Kofleriaceae bacterium]|nr:hypothetical protein [Kofleriaceae bacterium]
MLNHLSRFPLAVLAVATLSLGGAMACVADPATDVETASAPTTSVDEQDLSCIPDGGFDDVLGQTSCCSGFAVAGSTVCINPADFGTTWASCSQVCGTAPVNGCIPSGGWDDTLGNTTCCSGQAVPGSTRCLDPSDFGTDFKSCVQQCR